MTQSGGRSQLWIKEAGQWYQSGFAYQNKGTKRHGAGRISPFKPSNGLGGSVISDLATKTYAEFTAIEAFAVQLRGGHTYSNIIISASVTGEGGPTPDMPPIASIDAIDTIEDIDGNGSENVTLTQSSSDDNGIVSFEWSIAGSVVGTADSLNYDFPVGDTVVDLVVSDVEGQTSNDSLTVTVIEQSDTVILVDVGEIYFSSDVITPTQTTYLEIDFDDYTYSGASSDDVIDFTNFIDDDLVVSVTQSGDRSQIWIKEGAQWYQAKSKYAK